jgi:hypothetical protein
MDRDPEAKEPEKEKKVIAERDRCLGNLDVLVERVVKEVSGRNWTEVRDAGRKASAKEA